MSRLSALVLLATLACSGSAAPAASSASPAAVAPVLSLYLDAADKLASDDAAGASQALSALEAEAGKAAAGLDASGKAAVEKVGSVAHGVDGADLAATRASFQKVTTATLDLLTNVGNGGAAAVSVAHCPMAFDGAGAFWVQRGKAIRNPYFGSEMLGCGDVKATVEPGQKLALKR